MIAALAAHALIVTYDNIVDYDSNFQFVAHVMSMDTTLPGNVLMQRAITDKGAWSAAYAVIITIEALTGVLLVVLSALVLVVRVAAPPEVFLGRTRNDGGLWLVVFRLSGGRWRILRHVAVEALERAAGWVPRRHGDRRSADFRQSG